MRFIDEAKIRVAGGHGGPGCVSFWREKFIPRGGPDGGDGGDGGDVKFVASIQLGTLQDFRFQRIYQAPNGNHGSGANKAGRDGEDIILKVPVGTIIRDAETGEVLIDFMDDGQEWVACEGGRGGKGNAHFVTSTFQAPKFAQEGEEGTTRELKLELKLLADAAIIGFPNAGKSTLISRVSAARPKIADYAFTTLTPNLGVVSVANYQSYVIADTPGLIEGAHKGLGLGHRFLKHIERTRAFVHLLDGTRLLDMATRPELEGDASFKEAIDDLVLRYRAIRTELKLYNEDLMHKPEIVVLNKIDLLESDSALLARAAKALRAEIMKARSEEAVPQPIHPKEPLMISAVSGKGVDEFKGILFTIIQNNRVMGGEAADGRGQAFLPDDPRMRER